MRLIRDAAPVKGGAAVAQVSYSESGGFGVLSHSESRGAPVFAPRGIMYRPCEGDRVLMLEADGTETCVGCLSVPNAIEPGELKLCSAGGATAVFKNNGEIHLNSLIITKDGKIKEN